jgi:hypothetical protein
VYRGIDLKINQLIEDIGELNVRGELGVLSEEDAVNRKHLFGVIWHLLKSKESQLLQRARVRCLYQDKGQ